MLAAEEVDTVIFDDELRPGQMRALEKALGSKVALCDRTALILDIFSQRAASKEGQLQVMPIPLPGTKRTVSGPVRQHPLRESVLQAMGL